MKKILLIICLFSFTAVASAREWHSSKITRIYPQGNGAFALTFENSDPNCTNTSNPPYYYVRSGHNGVDAEGSKKIYSAALTAATIGKTVTINFDPSGPSCYINRLFIQF